MNRFSTALAAAGLVTATALPAVAQSDMDPSSMTCADFMAMESDGQMAAVEAMHSATLPGNEENISEGEMAEQNAIEDAESGGTMAEGEMASDDDTLPGNEENTSEGEMAEENAIEDAESGGTMAEGEMASEDGTLPGNEENISEGERAAEMVNALAEACEGNPDMMAMDAMASQM